MSDRTTHPAADLRQAREKAERAFAAAIHDVLPECGEDEHRANEPYCEYIAVAALDRLPDAMFDALMAALQPVGVEQRGLAAALASWFRRNGTCFTYDSREKQDHLPDELAEQIMTDEAVVAALRALPSEQAAGGDGLREMAERHLSRRDPRPGHPAYREPELPASEWRAAYFVLARIAQEQLDKAWAELAAAAPASTPVERVAVESFAWLPTFEVGQVVGDVQPGRRRHDWCSVHGDIGPAQSIAAHIESDHDMTYEQYRTLVELRARRAPVAGDGERGDG